MLAVFTFYALWEVSTRQIGKKLAARDNATYGYKLPPMCKRIGTPPAISHCLVLETLIDWFIAKKKKPQPDRKLSAG